MARPLRNLRSRSILHGAGWETASPPFQILRDACSAHHFGLHAGRVWWQRNTSDYRRTFARRDNDNAASLQSDSNAE